jgi:hypothetical protein
LKCRFEKSCTPLRCDANNVLVPLWFQAYTTLSGNNSMGLEKWKLDRSCCTPLVGQVLRAGISSKWTIVCPPAGVEISAARKRSLCRLVGCCTLHLIKAYCEVVHKSLTITVGSGGRSGHGGVWPSTGKQHGAAGSGPCRGGTVRTPHGASDSALCQMSVRQEKHHRAMPRRIIR